MKHVSILRKRRVLHNYKELVIKTKNTTITRIKSAAYYATQK